jgi:hypothetical protein
MSALMKEGKVTTKTYVWAAGEAGWEPIENKPALMSRLSGAGGGAPPPLPPPTPPVQATESKTQSAAPKKAAARKPAAAESKAGGGAKAAPKKKREAVSDILKQTAWSEFKTADGYVMCRIARKLQLSVFAVLMWGAQQGGDRRGGTRLGSEDRGSGFCLDDRVSIQAPI